MKVCVAQMRPVAGDLPANIVTHLRLVEAAVAKGAEIIVFPELSITGYEPKLAQQLAMHADDRRLDVFQTRSDDQRITSAVGAPT